jgi:hypothetical protein
MSGYPIIFGEGVDPDAYQYFLRAGIASGTQTPTSYDNAASFNGTNQFLSIPSNSTLQLGGTDFTLSGWVNLTSLQASDRLIFAKSNSTGGDYSFAISSSGQLKFARFNGSWATPNTTSTIPLNQWVHCVVTVSSLSLTFYINGNLSATAGGAYTLPSGIANQTNSDFSIGQYGNVTGNGLWLGSIGPCAIWKRALSASEVTALFNNGAGRTYASLDTGLRTNLISWWALNGNSSAVSLTDSHGTNTLTNNGTVTAPNIGPIVTTTQNSRQLINNFVKGIKSLGLWNSMVCWPLRASQNASTTLTARSLGGLGNFDGTFAGSLPVSAWGSQGITNTSTGFINTNLSVPSIPTHNMVVVNPSSTAIQCYCSDLSSSIARGIRAARQSLFVGNGTSFNIISYSNPTINTFRAIDYDVTALLATISLNGSSIATGSLSALPPAAIVTMKLMAAVDELGPSQWFPGTMSFYMHFSTNLTTTQVPEVYSLYKQTLGLGLGLP